MSQWTHVSGIVRIDRFPQIESYSKSNVLAVFGKNIPTGSEGPLSIAFMKSGFASQCVAWGQLAIWGDLRGHTSMTEIYYWLREACAQFNVRSCNVMVNVDGIAAYVVFKVNSELFVKELP